MREFTVVATNLLVTAQCVGNELLVRVAYRIGAEMSDALKPCPFCGYKQLRYETKQMGETWTQGICVSCGVRTPYFMSKDVVIKLWNQRHQTEGENDE